MSPVSNQSASEHTYCSEPSKEIDCSEDLGEEEVIKPGKLASLTANELTNLYIKASRHDIDAYQKLEGRAETDNFARGFYMALYAGGYGASQDYNKAEDISGYDLISWLLERSSQQYVDQICADFLLGICYYHGVNVIQDTAKAFETFNQSGERGYSPA